MTLFPDLPAPVEEGSGRIRPRARLLKTIGAELISSETVAVIELVRNCYDADATDVEILFHKPEDPASAYIEIRDNGHGMSRDVLLGPWLEPATDHKHGVGEGGTSGQLSPGGRRRLGSKGVGRFAAQRLGSFLELRTRGTNSPTELVARFDWRALERDRYLDQVRIPWREQTPRYLQGSGTHLRITKLRDHWTSDRFEKLKVGLARLVSPNWTERFQLRITINGAPEEITPIIDAESAMYSARGLVHEGGACEIHYRDINGAEETWERTVFWPAEQHQTCGPFSFSINAWDLDREPLKHFLELTGSKLGLRDFRRTIRDHSGISLYRDGFRILPYGEPDNDWLRLDRRRVNNPTMRLSNNQILGSIQLGANANPLLQDQTNREGLVTNEAYHHLQEVVIELMSYLETRRFSARRAMDIDWQRRTSALPTLHEDEEQDHINGLLDQLAGGNGSSQKAIVDLRSAVAEFRTSTADAVRHYAGLATSGQLAGLVFRQLEHPIRQIKSDLDLAVGDLDFFDSFGEDDVDDLRNSLKQAYAKLETMEARMKKLDPLILGRRGRRVSAHALRELLQPVLEAYKAEFHRRGVAMNLEGPADASATTNAEVAQQVLALLLDNALWWATEQSERAPIISVRVRAKGFSVSDNGPGVPAHSKTAIFEPHFTTREGAHGLGLTLAKDLLKTVGGRIRLVRTEPATFVVDLER